MTSQQQEIAQRVPGFVDYLMGQVLHLRFVRAQRDGSVGAAVYWGDVHNGVPSFSEIHIFFRGDSRILRRFTYFEKDGERYAAEDIAIVKVEVGKVTLWVGLLLSRLKVVELVATEDGIHLLDEMESKTSRPFLAAPAPLVSTCPA